ncbi:MAG: hypothetical protein QOJ68_2514 [Blastococcus sp.]|jgi:hypothetical protein|nr:hypothetical protein [Blastococcus sp.]
MTDNLLPRTPRPRSLQDDLLQDLRRTTPLPPRPSSPAARSRGEQPGDGKGRGKDGGTEAAAVEVRVTRSRWTSLRVRSNPGRSGFEVSAGPLRLSLAVVDR